MALRSWRPAPRLASMPRLLGEQATVGRGVGRRSAEVRRMGGGRWRCCEGVAIGGGATKGCLYVKPALWMKSKKGISHPKLTAW